ncbi:MAG: HAD family hydrolase [Elusimicrobiota bacterium]
MKKIILFDVDGTLVKAGGCGLKALNRAVAGMGGPRDICSKIEVQGSTDKDNFNRAFKAAFGRKPSKKEFLKLKKAYLEVLPEEVNRAVNSRKYEKIKGVEKFLERLSAEKDVVLALATGNFEEGAYLKLAPSGISHYFSFGGFGGDYEKREDMIKAAVKAAEKFLGCDCSSCQIYVIGDTEKDVQAAKAHGYHSGIVMDGFGHPERLRSNAPELIADNFSDIEPWLMWLGLKKDPKGVARGSYICPDTPIEHAYYGMTGMGSFLSRKDFNEMEKMIKKAKGRK